MAYGMGQLRKAGSFLLGADRKYAEALQAKNKQPPALEIGYGVPLGDIYSGGKADTLQERIALEAMSTAIGAANVASRYALPAGGVTLAGKALYDLTVQFGGQADQQEPNQLSM